MKIGLIDPPFDDELSVGESKSLKKVLNVIPSLGLAYIAAVLEKEGHEVKIFDCSIGVSFEKLKKQLSDFKPEIVGITGTTPSSPSMVKAARDVRENLPDAIILVGGAHLTAMPEETMKNDVFDIGVMREGEVTVVELLDQISKKGMKGLDTINGLVYRENGNIRITKPRELIKDIDQIPFPARHLLPSLDSYSPTPASYKKLPLGVIISSRGCPYPCTFCDRAVFGTRYRFRSVDNVLDEVEELINKYGAREIRFFDDCMTVDIDRMFKMCDGLKKRGIKIPWTCLTRVNTVTKDLLIKMKEAGCWQVLYGLESGDPRILKLLKKKASIEQIEKAVHWSKEAGLNIRADFIVGTPGETLESMQKTLDFALKLKVDYAHFNKFVPLPGTELYRDLINKGYKFDFSKSSSIVNHGALLYVPEGIDKETYKNFLNTAYRKFYLRPSYIIKKLFAIRSFDQLKGQINGFFAIFGLTGS